MLDGYVDFFMDPNLADCYLKLKEELDKLIQKKVSRYCFLAILFFVYLPNMRGWCMKFALTFSNNVTSS